VISTVSTLAMLKRIKLTLDVHERLVKISQRIRKIHVDVVAGLYVKFPLNEITDNEIYT
jgi:hypothetical protein